MRNTVTNATVTIQAPILKHRCRPDICCAISLEQRGRISIECRQCTCRIHPFRLPSLRPFADISSTVISPLSPFRSAIRLAYGRYTRRISSPFSRDRVHSEHKNVGKSKESLCESFPIGDAEMELIPITKRDGGTRCIRAHRFWPPSHDKNVGSARDHRSDKFPFLRKYL